MLEKIGKTFLAFIDIFVSKFLLIALMGGIEKFVLLGTLRLDDTGGGGPKLRETIRPNSWTAPYGQKLVIHISSKNFHLSIQCGNGHNFWYCNKT